MSKNTIKKLPTYLAIPPLKKDSMDGSGPFCGHGTEGAIAEYLNYNNKCVVLRVVPCRDGLIPDVVQSLTLQRVILVTHKMCCVV